MIVGDDADRAGGRGVGGAEFSASVKRACPRGSAFRAFPVLFNHLSAARMLDALLAAPVARDILESPADGATAFALRAHVAVYAEDTTAAWVMVGVRQSVLPQQPPE